LVSRANKYIDETEPWRLAKDEESINRLGTVLYNLVECIRIAMVLMAPAMPKLPQRANDQINIFSGLEELKWDTAEVRKGEVLFPRIDLQQMEEKHMENNQEAKENLSTTASELPKAKEYITYEEFARLDLRVAEVISCEKMEKADKLLILKVRLGEEQRTIVAGIAQHYEPQELIGKKVVIVANLQPAKLRGTMSEGMLLAASDDNHVEALMIHSDIAAGNRVK
jgi:methionyl-tRNA synthetase